MPKISIIVPVYNSDSFLGLCLDSILSQTFKDYEVILVDDGSTDRSGFICDNYAAKDRRFNVFHKRNGGVSSARNLGIDNATGEWIYFVDADDLLYDYTLEAFVNRISSNIDSVCGGYVRIEEKNGGIIQYSSSRNYEVQVEREDALIDFYEHSYGDLFNGYLWNRLLKADIIKSNNLKFKEDVYIKEDGLFLVEFFCKSYRFHSYTSLPLYKYRINYEGAMKKNDKSFNKKTLSNLYARCYCYNEIMCITDNEQLLKLAKDSISIMYRQLLGIIIRERKKEFRSVIEMSRATFKYISPFRVIRDYVKGKVL